MGRQPEAVLPRESNRAGDELLGDLNIDAHQLELPAGAVEAGLHVLVQQVDPAKGVLQPDAPDVDEEDRHRKSTGGIAANHLKRRQPLFLPVAVDVARLDLANLSDALV